MTTDVLFPVPVRESADLLASGLEVIDRAILAGASMLVPLFSSGDDSQVACHVASQHPAFTDTVYHINTGIGANAAREHAKAVCREHGWNLRVYESPATYEQFVRDRGFPGPGRHQWVYNRIKERCVRQMMREHPRKKVALITGCREQESVRRMGHVEAIKIGETSKTTGKVREKRRVWTAPCFDWSSEEQADYMDEYGLTPNPVKPVLGMSGECFCGAFAAPGERERIDRYCPDVGREIDRLTVIARECGKHDKWGTRPPDEKGLILARSGPLCSSCEHRARSAALLFED